MYFNIYTDSCRLFGKETNALIKNNSFKIRVLVSYPIIGLSLYFYFNTMLPSMNGAMLLWKIWGFILLFVIASFFDNSLRRIFMTRGEKNIRYYPPLLLGRYGDGICDFHKYMGVFSSKRKLIKKDVEEYFNNESKNHNEHREIERYIDNEALKFYYDYNKDYKTKREIQDMINDIRAYKSNDESHYNKYIKYGAEGLVEYYTNCLMKDFRYPITTYMSLFIMVIFKGIAESIKKIFKID